MVFWEILCVRLLGFLKRNDHVSGLPGKEGRVYPVEYEGLQLACFHCGHYGHKKDCCPLFVTEKPLEINIVSQPEKDSSSIVAEEVSRVESSFRPWMLVQKPWRANRVDCGSRTKINGPIKEKTSVVSGKFREMARALGHFRISVVLRIVWLGRKVSWRIILFVLQVLLIRET
ncbi:Zinc finger, CCHC-type [Sesbania bispinosa]|nr:Zinc finger, CCHC-type [Sesbania bispinosa]